MSASRLLCSQLQTSAHLADIDALGQTETHALQRAHVHTRLAIQSPHWRLTENQMRAQARERAPFED